jgi:hypothetical protein
LDIESEAKAQNPSRCGDVLSGDLLRKAFESFRSVDSTARLVDDLFGNFRGLMGKKRFVRALYFSNCLIAGQASKSSQLNGASRVTRNILT